MFFWRTILYIGLKLVCKAVNELSYPTLISIQNLDSQEIAQVLPEKEKDLTQLQERVYNSYSDGVLRV